FMTVQKKKQIENKPCRRGVRAIVYYSNFAGVLIGVYQISMFFESIIRENIFQLNDQTSLRLSQDKIITQHQENITQDLINEISQIYLDE
ncbi:unnamed protein product, partial [Rotaria sordida]